MEEEKGKNNMRYILGTGLFLFLCGVYGVYAAEDATLSLSSSRTSYIVGEDVSMKIVVSSPTQEINAVSGAVSFPASLLKLKSIDKEGSLVSFWAQEPSFDNTLGVIQFEGVIFNPVFLGGGGVVLTLHFEPKVAGTAALQFNSGSVLANDGIGTNVLNKMNGVEVRISPSKTDQEKGTEKPKTITIPKVSPIDLSRMEPKVHSPTHPSSTHWYANSNPQFTWDLPSSVTAVAFSINKDPQGDSGPRSGGRITTHTFNNVEDGKWYFHIQFKTSAGWGSIAHFPFNIDTSHPEKPYIFEIIKKNVVQGDWTFKFLANDDLSGIDRYEIFVDNKKGEIQQGGGEHTYHIRGLFLGMHSLVIRAVDKAGNTSTETIRFGDVDGWNWLHTRNIVLAIFFALILFFFLKTRKKAGLSITKEY